MRVVRRKKNRGTAWPLAVGAQQSTMPVIGFLGSTSPDEYASRLRVFREGLKDTGFVEGENLRVEYRWADGQNDRLRKLASELAGGLVSYGTDDAEYYRLVGVYAG